MFWKRHSAHIAADAPGPLSEVEISRSTVPAASGRKASTGKRESDPSFFGQFLIEKKVSRAVLESAPEIKGLDGNRNLHGSHRLPGEILMDEFNIFSSRVELNRLLVKFNDFKAQLERQRTEPMRITR